MKQKRIAVAGVTAAMIVGAGTGVVLNLPSGAGATSSPATTDATPTTEATPTTDATPSTDAPAPPDAPAPDAVKHPLQDALDALVKDGTITQDQEDKIVAALQAARPSADGKPGRDHGGKGHLPGGGMPGGGMGGFGGFGGAAAGLLGGLGKGLDAAATAIGVTTDELKTDLMNGQSIADVAKAKGVDPQTVIDAIVAAESGALKDIVTQVVNGTLPKFPGGRDHGPGKPDDSVPDDSVTPTTGG